MMLPTENNNHNDNDQVNILRYQVFFGWHAQLCLGDNDKYWISRYDACESKLPVATTNRHIESLHQPFTLLKFT